MCVWDTRLHTCMWVWLIVVVNHVVCSLQRRLGGARLKHWCLNSRSWVIWVLTSTSSTCWAPVPNTVRGWSCRTRHLKLLNYLEQTFWCVVVYSVFTCLLCRSAVSGDRVLPLWRSGWLSAQEQAQLPPALRWQESHRQRQPDLLRQRCADRERVRPQSHRKQGAPHFIFNFFVTFKKRAVCFIFCCEATTKSVVLSV